MNLTILGSTGFLGSRLSLKLSQYNPFMPNRKNLIKENGALYFDKESLEKIQSSEVIINCIANTNFIDCEKSGLSDEANILVPNAISQVVKDQYLIHISSDIFYEDKKNFSNEESNITVCNMYAAQKKKSEEILMSKNSLILRTSFVGLNQRNTGLLNTINNAVSTNSEMSGWNNVFSSAVHISHVTDLISKIITGDKIYGIYNFGTDRPYTKADFIEKVLLSLRSENLLKRTNLVGENINRNLNGGMSSDRIKKDLDILLPSFKDVINLSLEEINHKYGQK